MNYPKQDGVVRLSCKNKFLWTPETLCNSPGPLQASQRDGVWLVAGNARAAGRSCGDKVAPKEPVMSLSPPRRARSRVPKRRTSEFAADFHSQTFLFTLEAFVCLSAQLIFQSAQTEKMH